MRPKCSEKKKLTLAVDVSQHLRRNVDSEDIVRIGEEPDTSDDADLCMEPSTIETDKVSISIESGKEYKYE